MCIRIPSNTEMADDESDLQNACQWSNGSAFHFTRNERNAELTFVMWIIDKMHFLIEMLLCWPSCEDWCSYCGSPRRRGELADTSCTWPQQLHSSLHLTMLPCDCCDKASLPLRGSGPLPGAPPAGSPAASAHRPWRFSFGTLCLPVSSYRE